MMPALYDNKYEIVIYLGARLFSDCLLIVIGCRGYRRSLHRCHAGWRCRQSAAGL
jgi:hypothetical protein